MTTATWDGLPASDTDPRGANVIVYREGRAGPEVLVIHRAHRVRILKETGRGHRHPGLGNQAKISTLLLKEN